MNSFSTVFVKFFGDWHGRGLGKGLNALGLLVLDWFRPWWSGKEISVQKTGLSGVLELWNPMAKAKFGAGENGGEVERGGRERGGGRRKRRKTTKKSRRQAKSLSSWSVASSLTTYKGAESCLMFLVLRSTW
mgnify:CR=1 FL=1